MLKILNVLLCIVLLGTFTACDHKTDEEQAQDQASVLVDEQNSIANQLRTMGTPRVTWSDSRLNEYENLIDRLQSVEEDLGNLNGTNGISIYGNNQHTIPAMRAVLASVRARKTSGSVSSITIPTLPTIDFDSMADGDEGPQFSADFAETELGERAEELHTAIETFKNDNPHYLLMDYDEFTFEELMEAQAAVRQHLVNLNEYHEILEQRYSEATGRTSYMDDRDPLRGVSEAMNLMILVDQMTVGSDIATAGLGLQTIENEIETARVDGRAEEYLMGQSVAQ